MPLMLPATQRASTSHEVAAIVRDAIFDDRLRSGTVLPSSRDLASQLGVARNTVLRALSQLIDEDLIEVRTGVGTFVKHIPSSKKVTDKAAYPYVLTKWAGKLPAGQQSELIRNALIDLRPGIPDLQSIPFDEWRSSAVRKRRTLKLQMADYGPPEGDADLRRSISVYVARSRGVQASPDNIIITAGAQQAFDLVTRILIPAGTKAGVEEPGYRPVIQTLHAGGAEICTVPVDDDGLIIERIPAGVKVIYVTPSHQYPLGVTMSHQRRRELIDWADDNNGFIIEDDYDCEYLYSNHASPALHSSVKTDRVLYIGTFSKNLMPGIRLGYLIVPEALRDIFATARFLVDRHSDNTTQSVLAEFMSSGLFDRHVMKMRKVYASRHEVLQASVAELAAQGARLLPSQLGLHACIRLPTGMDEDAFIASAAAHEVGLYGLKPAFTGDPTFSGVIVGFGNVAAGRLAEALHRMIAIMSKR